MWQTAKKIKEKRESLLWETINTRKNGTKGESVDERVLTIVFNARTLIQDIIVALIVINSYRTS